MTFIGKHPWATPWWSGWGLSLRNLRFRMVFYTAN